jgi:hypothetical protein
MVIYCCMYWEQAWPKDTNPSDKNMDAFIRAKYERKQYAMKGALPDPSTLSGSVVVFLQAYLRMHRWSLLQNNQHLL